MASRGIVLSLACALVHEPALLVLDEPTAGIDPILRRTVWDELHRLRERGVTIIATTQYVTEAEECDHVALIAHGRVVAYGTPEELRRRAMGGDEIELTTDTPFDGEVLQQVAGVRSVRQIGLREFRVVVDDAGSATPEIVDAVTQAGSGVAGVRASHPSFEDVFTRLVEAAPADAEAGPAQPEPDRAQSDAAQPEPAQPEPDEPAPAEADDGRP